MEGGCNEYSLTDRDWIWAKIIIGIIGYSAATWMILIGLRVIPAP